MKKIFSALILAPLAFAADLAFAAPVAPSPTTESITEPVTMARSYRRYRYCYRYRRNCVGINTPIGGISVGNCHRTCNRWGWRYGWLNVASTQPVYGVDVGEAQPLMSTAASNLAQTYGVNEDAADVYVKAVSAASQGDTEPLAMLGLEPSDLTAPTPDASERLAQTLDVDASTAARILTNAQ